MGRSGERVVEAAGGLTYREECARIAAGFERFLCEYFISMGRRCELHVGKRAQLAHGDLHINDENAEVKFDQLHHGTGNYYIEIAERRSSRVTWVNSGIYASSDARWYIVGDYTGVMVFERETLRTIARRYEHIEIERGTSRGFLIEGRYAFSIATFYQYLAGRTWNGQIRSIE